MPFASSAILQINQQCVDHNVLIHVIGESQKQTLWTKLAKLYAQKFGKNRLFTGKTDDGFEIPKWDFIAKSLEYIPRNINQLATKGVKFD